MKSTFTSITNEHKYCRCSYSYSYGGCGGSYSYSGNNICPSSYCPFVNTRLSLGSTQVQKMFTRCTPWNSKYQSIAYVPSDYTTIQNPLTITEFRHDVRASKTYVIYSIVNADYIASSNLGCSAGWMETVNGSCLFYHKETRCDQRTLRSQYVPCLPSNSCQYQEVLLAPGTKYYKSYPRSCAAETGITETVSDAGRVHTSYFTIVYQQSWSSLHTITHHVARSKLQPCPSASSRCYGRGSYSSYCYTSTLCSRLGEVHQTACGAQSHSWLLYGDYCPTYGQCTHVQRTSGQSYTMDQTYVRYWSCPSSPYVITGTRTTRVAMNSVPHFLSACNATIFSGVHTFQGVQEMDGTTVGSHELHVIFGSGSYGNSTTDTLQTSHGSYSWDTRSSMTRTPDSSSIAGTGKQIFRQFLCTACTNCRNL